MEIGGLGFFNSVAAVKQPAFGKSEMEGGFAGMMAMVLSGANGAKTAETPGQDTKALESLADLAGFLNTEDLLDLEDGLKLMESLMTDSENLLGQALSHLGISMDQVQLLLQKWSGINEGRKDNLPEDELLASLAAILAGIANLPKNELAARLDTNDVETIKALKLYELMSKYADGYESKSAASLKETVQKLEETLTSLLKPDNRSGQSEYIQTRFTQLARELNLLNAKKTNFTEVNSLADTEPSIKTDGQTGAVTFLPQMGRAEQLTLMMNSPERPVSAEQLMKQFEAILSKSQFMNSGGTQKLFIKLFPEHLGSIRVELFQKDQTMMARIITTSGTAKETLESHINGLKQAFAAQNLSVERIEVSQQQAQQERFLNRDSQQQERQQDNREREKKEDQGDFTLTFEEALLNTEA
ncbi:flagellar hook-length control protein FliK [Bacillus sp. ISL-35]|uniref:flagellar hook-length control protein FliK n=1 Tax=Bacillus sp. ISL-35 TaxID=2819122 RepID=UPI001BE50F89|nr:flagellar hook-length control protein FliK [Bacillus sp. ISL-35]MBT2681356.1 flagellar hook-length control protein FliK [Bacillus sp. ISL-35]MBT2701823.1 flagellar hook-length control protein FliK [Chryseobacterium sp. ISL-80]